jgi:hypothetical protein
VPTLWFVVPVHGRLPLAAICLRQLRRTCDALRQEGVEATAVIVADRPNLRELNRRLKGNLGFGTVERDNQFLSRRFNDGIQLACDPKYNPRPADYIVPIGSDDWVDYRILLDLPDSNTIIGFQQMSFVREDGKEMVARFLNYTGGSGIRIYPRDVVRRLGFRPADEDRRRGCDTSILTNIASRQRFLNIRHREIDARQLVDWKSPGQQLNAYSDLAKYQQQGISDPFDSLAEIYPAEALREMRAHYQRSRVLVAA